MNCHARHGGTACKLLRVNNSGTWHVISTTIRFSESHRLAAYTCACLRDCLKKKLVNLSTITGWSCLRWLGFFRGQYTSKTINGDTYIYMYIFIVFRKEFVLFKDDCCTCQGLCLKMRVLTRQRLIFGQLTCLQRVFKLHSNLTSTTNKDMSQKPERYS